MYPVTKASLTQRKYLLVHMQNVPKRGCGENQFSKGKRKALRIEGGRKGSMKYTELAVVYNMQAAEGGVIQRKTYKGS